MPKLGTYSKLFVVGCPRSGTSWVTTLIGSHPDVIMVPAETHIYRLIYEPFVTLPTWTRQRRFRSWKGIWRRYGLKPLLFGLQPSDIWRGILRDYQILNRPNSHGLHNLICYQDFQALIETVRTQPGSELERAEQSIAALFDRFFEQQQGNPHQTLLEKTPMHIKYVDRILELFPHARIVEVVRDGRDVCVSYNALAKQYAWARIGTAGAIGQWKRCINWGKKFRTQTEFAPRIHTVRYEVLKANPDASLQQIFDFARLNWNELQIKEIVQAADISQIDRKGEGQYIRAGRVGDWKNKLSQTEIELCQKIAGEELKALGYA